MCAASWAADVIPVLAIGNKDLIAGKQDVRSRWFALISGIFGGSGMESPKPLGRNAGQMFALLNCASFQH